MSEILKGFCQCGCGQRTLLAKVNDRSKGWVKGEPLRYLNRHSIKFAGSLRPRAPVGTKFVSSHGYIEVSLGDGRYQYEHIIKAEKALGRPLRNFGIGHADNEVVHHIDGNKTNNENSNLLLCTHSYHTALHHRLEQSPAWPEFPKIVRNIYGNKGKAGSRA